jgi:citrate lyase subunit beta/citryl-CoA lyase
MIRSYLFVPGDRPDRFDKACGSRAGLVIIDLEDAVPPDRKIYARTTVAAWLNPRQSVALRINASDTPWFEDDLTLCKCAGIAAVVLPKAENVEDLARIAAAAPSATVLPLIETAKGFASIGTLALAPRVERLVFGSIDFQLDLGIEGDGEELLFFRSQIVLASRLAGLDAPVDGVCVTIDDASAVLADALRGRRIGFGAKLCIHPNQVLSVESAFAVSDEERAWAHRVIDAAERAQGAAVAVDGRMIDRPRILKAQTILQHFAQSESSR